MDHWKLKEKFAKYYEKDFSKATSDTQCSKCKEPVGLKQFWFCSNENIMCNLICDTCADDEEEFVAINDQIIED